MGVFFTTFLLLQIILLFLYKAFIVDIAKKMRKTWWKIRCRFIIIRWKVYWNAWMITWIFYWDIDCF